MSDYENDDWDSAELAPARHIDPPVDFFNVPIGPKGYKLQDVMVKQRRRVHGGKFQLLESFEPTIQGIKPAVNIGTVDGQRTTFLHPSKSNTATSSYQRWQRLALSPDHTYELQKFPDTLQKHAQHRPNLDKVDIIERITEISATSEAYLQPRSNNPKVIGIWGTHEQCQKAVTMLDAWQTECRETLQRHKRVVWTKEAAQDGRKQHRQLEKAYDQYAKEMLKELDDEAFPFEAYLIWPSNFDLDTYLRDHKIGALPALSEEFSCRFRHDKSSQARYTRVQAQTESQLLAAYQRLIGLSKEMLSRKVQALQANFFLLPTFHSYKSHVVLTRDALRNSFRITLAGSGREDELVESWTALVRKMEVKTRRVLRESVETFIKRLYGSQKLIRLRVTFGDLNLISFPKPKDGSDRYRTDEFLELTQQPRAQFSDCVLQAPGRDMAHAFGLLKIHKQFSFVGDAFQVCCDFQKSEFGDLVRLEIEFERAVGQTDVEIHAQRWVAVTASKDGSSRLLSMKVLALDGPSFSLQASSHSLLPSDSITKEMNEFQKKLSFQPGQDTFPKFPHRRAQFPLGQQGLISITERATARFQSKATDGILELTRDDVFSHGIGFNSSHCSSSTWNLSYYYLGWDSLLDEFASIKAGEEVSWGRKLATFFPSGLKGDVPGCLPNGFRGFWTETRDIQDVAKNILLGLPHNKTSNDDTV